MRRAPLLFLLLLCASAAWAQEPPAANAAELEAALNSKVAEEHAALQRAEQQEEATEHAPIAHDRAPAALEDVDEFKGEPAAQYRGLRARELPAGLAGESESEVQHEMEMEHENSDDEHGQEHAGGAAHISTALSTFSGNYAVAVPVQSPGSESEISSPNCHAAAGAAACSGHGICQLNPGSEQHFCECTEGWFGPQCQCGEQPYECTESNHCHWCGPLTLCLMSKEECEAGESALHGQVNRGAARAPTRRVTHCIAPAGAPQPGHAAAPVSRALPSIAAGGRALTRAAGWKRRLRRCRSGRAYRRKTPRYPR